MEEIITRQFRSFDGRMFDSASACRAHERENADKRLIGLTAEQVAAAMSREDADLADAIEQCGLRINRERRADGDLKRQRRGEASSETPPGAPAVEAGGGEQAPSAAGTRACDLPVGDNGASPGSASPIQAEG